jgi:hypothetical protein
VKALEAVQLVKQAAQEGGVDVKVLFEQAHQWGLGRHRILDVRVEVSDFLAYQKDEETGYQVPDGVIRLAQIALSSPNPKLFFRRE